MCMDCGCHKPNDDHGDQRHITMKDLEQAAQASKTSVDQVAQRIQQEVQQSGSGASSMRSGSTS